MQTWQIQTAKARFSELVKQAAEDGPQEITLHGKPVAVVLSREAFERLNKRCDIERKGHKQNGIETALVDQEPAKPEHDEQFKALQSADFDGWLILQVMHTRACA